MTRETLDADGIERLITMRDAINAVCEGFVELARGSFEMPLRSSLNDGRFLVMPVHHRPSGTMVVKSLSLNFDRVPAIAGSVTWTVLDRADQLVADAVAVTTMRTGAAVGAATDLLAPPSASRLAIIGTGAQALHQVLAVHTVRPLAVIVIVGRNPGRAEQFASTVRTRIPEAETRVVIDADSAVADVDIVCCATNATAPLFSRDALSDEVHVNAIGAFRPTMRELPNELLAEAKVVVDDRAAVLAEAGDIIDAVNSGSLSAADLFELGALAGEPDRPQQRPARTVFKSVGVAAQDWALANLLATRVFARPDR